MANTNQTPREIIARWAALCQSNPQAWSEPRARYKWRISGDGGGTFLMRCMENPSVLEEDSEADCEIALGVDDFVAIASGDLNPQEAFLAGKVQVAGDLGVVVGLNLILEDLVSD